MTPEEMDLLVSRYVNSFAITCSDILGWDKQLGWNLIRNFREEVMAGRRPLLLKESGQGLQDLIKSCWERDLH